MQEVLSRFRCGDRYWRPWALLASPFVWDFFFLMGEFDATMRGIEMKLSFFFPFSVALFPRKLSALNAKRQRCVFNRRHWIDPPEQPKTFPSNLGSIHPTKHSAQVPPPESKKANPIFVAASNPPELLSVWLLRHHVNSGWFQELGGQIGFTQDAEVGK